MQTYTQTFAASQTWTLHVPGKYFVTLGCGNPVNVRFFLHGRKLALGDISQLLAGLEVTLGDIADPLPAFDRVEIDVTGPDTVQVGIGNGQARYNRSQGNVAITNMPAVPWSGAPNVAITNMPAVPWSGAPNVAIQAPTYGASYQSSAAKAGNTPDTVFLPAANVNGAIIWSAAFMSDQGTSVTQCAFVAKASAPASPVDGAVIVGIDNMANYSGSYAHMGSLRTPIKMPAGLGLYYVSGIAEGIAMRNVLYTLL